MIPSECGQLLRACSFYDNRKVTEEAMIAWSHAIAADVTAADAIAAITAHHADTDDWCGPSHVNRRVRAIRRDRLQRAGIPPIPSDLDQATERLWSRAWCAAVKDGADDPQQLANEAVGIENRPLELVPMPHEVRLAIDGFAKAHSVPES